MFFETLPNRFIPIQNVIIGFISGVVCDFTLYELRILFVSVNVSAFPIVVSIVFVLKLGLL